MPTFVLVYRQPASYTPTAETAAAWHAWFAGLGGQLTDLGKPVVSTTALGGHGDSTQLGGYSLINADNLDAALAIAKGCPHLEHGGGVEIGQLGEVPAPAQAGPQAG